MKLWAWGLTDVGRKREHNEDAYLVRTDMGLFAVADGMGGHQGGDRASRLAVEIIEREICKADLEGSQSVGPSVESPPARELRTAARLAGRTIFNLAQKDPRLTGMGTTLTSLFFHGGRAYLAHVGDSRAYLYRDERIEQLTEDHSWIEEQVRSGFMTTAEAQESALKHIITRSVGFESDVEVDQLTLPFLMGDCFLLCSDGLSNHLTEEEIRQCISEGYYARVPEQLVEAANEKGGEDNITVVLVYVANDARKAAVRRPEEQDTTQRITLEMDAEEAEFDPYSPTVDVDITGAGGDDP
jgi:serine/threonine protein phosphatase PrpC